MKKFLKFPCIAVAALSLIFASCSDENNVPDPILESSNIAEVFPMGLPASVNGMTITQNDKGQVTKISDRHAEITFEYGSISRATKYDVVMKYRDKEDPEEDYDIYMQLNDKGFVSTGVVEYLYDEDDYEVKIEYNSDNQPRLFVWTDAYGTVENRLTYSDGGVAKIEQYEDGSLEESVEFLYTNSTYRQPVTNKGGVTFFNPFDDAVHYAGLLGKSPFKNLPMADSYDEYIWKFNADKLPIAWGWHDDETGEDEWEATWSWK
ncbi:MAG: hypothetical protein K2H84_03305 [Paramuribaculum sp.]|nr:hypothetical protein [Paramuribaculum sp.]